MSIQIEQEVYETLPVGEYVATISDIEPTDGLYGQQLKFTFTITEPEERAGRDLLGWCNAKFSRQSKLFKWTKAAFGGGPIDTRYNFDSSHIVGNRVRLVVVIKTNDNGEYNKVEEVLPVQAQPAAVAQQAAAAPAATPSELYDRVMQDADEPVPF